MGGSDIWVCLYLNISPEQTAWEGGCFELLLVFSNDYPARPPEVKFMTEIFHPNVYPDGRICLDILKE